MKISALPSSIDTESARVTGLGDAAVLFDVVCAVSTDQVRSMHADVQSEVLKDLERRKSVLTGEKGMRKHQADILAQYGQTLNAEHHDVSVLNDVLDNLVVRSRDTLEASADLDKRIDALDQQIADEKRKLTEQARRAATYGKITAVIMAKRAGDITITLTYSMYLSRESCITLGSLIRLYQW